MKKLAIIGAVASLVLIWLALDNGIVQRTALASSTAGGAKAPESTKQEGQQKSTAEELIGLEKRRQQLIEKEAALSAKEQELNRLASGLDARIKQLNDSQKAYEASLNEKKKKEAELAKERYMKMVKLLKAMRPDESAKIIDKLDEPVAIGLLDTMDQKTVIKLSRHISQPRLQKWIKGNLQSGQR